MISCFNAGELTPLLRFRPELEKYASGCALLENFTILPQGGIENRPGTEFLAEALGDTVRLVPFSFSVSQSYMLEFSALAVRVFRDGVPGGTVATPYAGETLRMLRFVQSADVLYLVHPDYPPASLSRYGEADWRYAVLDFKSGPFMDENTTATKVTASALTGAVTLTADGDVFEPGMAGMLFELVHPNKTTQLSHKFTADGVSDSFAVSGTWKLTTTGGWFGTLTLQRSFDAGASWQDYRSWSSAQDKNVDSSGVEARDSVIYRMKMTNFTPSTSQVSYSCTASLSVEKYWVHGAVTLETIVSKREARGTVKQPLASLEPTADWSFGAWNAFNGFPGCICFYEDRLCFANTRKQPQSIWLSKTGDYLNFELGDNADDAMTFTIRSAQLDAISWMLPLKKIVLGTRSGEGLLGAVDENEPMHPANRKYTPETTYGSAKLPALLVNDVIVFLQRGGEHLREMTYDMQQDGYRAPDVSLLAEHILPDGALEVSFQPLPFPVIYFLRKDGQIAAFTYERVQNVTAFGRFVTDGQITSLAVVSHEEHDELYVGVRRGEKTFIERFFPRKQGFFLDCAKYVDLDTPAREISGLEHLEGRTVSALADGSEVVNLVVTGGKITLPVPASKVLAGLPYVAAVETIPLEMAGQDGSTVGMKKRTVRCKIKFFQSLGGRAGAVGGTMRAIDWRLASHIIDRPVPPQFGEYELLLDGRIGPEAAIRIEQQQPLPMTVLAIINDLVLGDV